MSQIIKSDECTNVECRAGGGTGATMGHQSCIGENCAHWQPVLMIEQGIRFRDAGPLEETNYGKCGLSS